jgi:ribosomal protein S18 acetylase RimI-like enzyme
MKRGIQFRVMEIDDLGEVYRIGVELFGNCAPTRRSWDTTSLAEMLSRHLPTSFVAARRNNIYAFLIGAIFENDRSEEAEILWLGVPESDQREAITNGLLEAFIDSAKERGVPCISACLPGKDREILSFYNKIGFTKQDHILDLTLFLSK